MQHVDTDMFLTENAAIFPGIVTTNDLYNMISIEEMFVPLAHGVHGDQVLKLIDEFAIGNDTDTVAVSSTIKNRQKYTLYTITKDEDALQDSMEQLNITITTSLPSTPKEYMINDVSLQSVWIDFVMKQWTYDDNSCMGLDDSSNSGSGKHNHDDGKHTHDKDGSTNTSGGEANVAANSPSRGDVTSQSNNSDTQPTAAGLSAVLLVAIAVVGTLAYVIIRKSRSPNRQSWETSISRQSELGNSNNDLELRADDAHEDEDRSVDYAPPMSSFA